VDPLCSCERGKQHDPAAHARADQDLSTLGQRIENRDRVLCPAADRPHGKIAARCPLSEIIKAHKSVPAAPAIFVEKRSLGSGHVGAEAAEKHHTRTATGEPVVGDCCSIITW